MINIVSVPFPPSPQAGDVYSIWKYDGLYWMLDPDQTTGGAVEWERLLDKPQQIDALGIENLVSSGAYQPASKISAKDAPDGWTKKEGVEE
jgi:hypothetical protein